MSFLENTKVRTGALLASTAVLLGLAIQAWGISREIGKDSIAVLLNLKALEGKVDVAAVRLTAVESAVTDMRDQTSAIPGLRAEISFMRESLADLRGQVRDSIRGGGAGGPR